MGEPGEGVDAAVMACTKSLEHGDLRTNYCTCLQLVLENLIVT